ncbi:unnamed protein product [Protopolystoma xenopodis]|uniref:Carboxylesterase type B domain-containing protein n=1 Tax=Protopolystoma xenopodis TaxID=117903 RepID=A0A3S5CN52_9PLAT|nr:unnamed protein product [Protopolystoma xenopodis]
MMSRLDELAGDIDFRCPTLGFADAVARLPDAQVFLYEFRQATAAWPFPRWTGVMHGYEIEYVFGMPFSERFQAQFYPFTAIERQLSRKMMRFWANFARTG